MVLPFFVSMFIFGGEVDSQITRHKPTKNVTRLKRSYEPPRNGRPPSLEDFEKVNYLSTRNKYKIMEMIPMDTALKMVKLRNSLKE